MFLARSAGVASTGGEQPAAVFDPGSNHSSSLVEFTSHRPDTALFREDSMSLPSSLFPQHVRFLFGRQDGRKLLFQPSARRTPIRESFETPSGANPMILRTTSSIVVLVLSVLAFGPARSSDESRTAAPAPAESGVLLPNGWRLTPAGRQVLLTDLPLNITTSPDGHFAFVATSGYNAHELTAIDLETEKKAAVETVPQSWFGLTTDSRRERFWWSGGGEGSLLHFAWTEGKFQRLPSPVTRPPADSEAASTARPGFRTGLHFDEKTGVLYSLMILPKGENKSFAWGDAVSDERAGGTDQSHTAHSRHDHRFAHAAGRDSRRLYHRRRR